MMISECTVELFFLVGVGGDVSVYDLKVQNDFPPFRRC